MNLSGLKDFRSSGFSASLPDTGGQALAFKPSIFVANVIAPCFLCTIFFRAPFSGVSFFVSWPAVCFDHFSRFALYAKRLIS